MSSRDDILARLQAHAIAPEKRPEMDFEPLAFDNPVLRAAGRPLFSR